MHVTQVKHSLRAVLLLWGQSVVDNRCLIVHICPITIEVVVPEFYPRHCVALKLQSHTSAWQPNSTSSLYARTRTNAANDVTLVQTLNRSGTHLVLQLLSSGAEHEGRSHSRWRFLLLLLVSINKKDKNIHNLLFFLSQYHRMNHAIVYQETNTKLAYIFKHIRVLHKTYMLDHQVVTKQNKETTHTYRQPSSSASDNSIIGMKRPQIA